MLEEDEYSIIIIVKLKNVCLHQIIFDDICLDMMRTFAMMGLYN